jgi:hypothetical protein
VVAPLEGRRKVTFMISGRSVLMAGFLDGVVALGVVASPSPAQAAEDETAVGLFFNPAALAFGYYGLELDISPIRLLSINMAGSYYSRDITTAYEVDGGLQFFLTGDRPMKGAYLYPRVAYASAKAEQYGIKATASLIGFGATAGYQWNWQPFALRLGGGFIYYNAVGEGGDGDSSVKVGMDGIAPALDLALGFVF